MRDPLHVPPPEYPFTGWHMWCGVGQSRHRWEPEPTAGVTRCLYGQLTQVSVIGHRQIGPAVAGAGKMAKMLLRRIDGTEYEGSPRQVFYSKLAAVQEYANYLRSLWTYMDSTPSAPVPEWARDRLREEEERIARCIRLMTGNPHADNSQTVAGTEEAGGDGQGGPVEPGDPPAVPGAGSSRELPGADAPDAVR